MKHLLSLVTLFFFKNAKFAWKVVTVNKHKKYYSGSFD